jgi:hypothetical protein
MKRVAVAALAAVLGGTAAHAQPGKIPKTLAYADSPILTFAHDGRYVAWVSTKNCTGTVRVRDLVAKVQKAVGRAAEGDCDNLRLTRLTLGGDRALWTLHDHGNELYDYVYTGGLTGKPRLVGENIHDMPPYPVGDHLASIAGGGGATVWSKAYVSVHGSEDCDIQGTCVTYLKSGFTYRAKARSTKIPGAGAAALLATDGTRIALVPATTAGPRLRPKPNANVEVRGITAGGLAGTFKPTGPPKGLAILGGHVAVLTSSAIEYRTRAGALLWKKSVPAGAASLSLSALGVVYRVGKAIRLFTPAGLPVAVATAKATPIGLRASGRRIAWAENVMLGGKLTGRIQAVEL